MAKNRVSPKKQTTLVVVLTVLPVIGFVLFVSIEHLELVSQQELWLTEERIAVFGLLPFLVPIPFIRIRKTIKASLHVIPLWISSITYVLSSTILMYDVGAMIAAIATTAIIFLATSIGHYMKKWSQKWNKQFEGSFLPY